MALSVFSTFKCGDIRLRFLKGNIATWEGDCVVNAANMQLVPSTLPDYWRHRERKDVNSAIHAEAGPGLAKECSSLPAISECNFNITAADWVASAPTINKPLRCDRGDARITSGHLLKVKHVIHAVGPDYATSVLCTGSPKTVKIAHKDAERLLECTYAKVFELANDAEAMSIGIPALSCGVMGFGGADSLNDAARVSIASCLQFAGSVRDIDFVLWDETTIDAWMEAASKNLDLQAA
jgi:O-acetyl-ADP-ribose deacetylase (regulator of RNase III)